VRVPVPVQACEARGGKRLVDRRHHLHPRITLGHAGREIGELARERGIEETGVARTASVVHKPDDRLEVELAQASERAIGPRPTRFVCVGRRDLLPEHRVANGGDAEGGKAIEVVKAAAVTARFDLVEVAITDPVDRALETAP
jgi:hypothetical protein